MNKSQLHTPSPSAHTSATSITDMMFAPATAVCNRPVFLFFLISFSLPAKNSTRYLGHFLRNRSTVTFIYYYLQLGLVEQYIISRGHVCWCLSHLTQINPCFLSRDTPYLLEHKIPHRPTLVSKIQSNGLRASLSCYSPPVVDCTSPDEHTTLKPSCPLRHGEMPATPL